MGRAGRVGMASRRLAIQHSRTAHRSTGLGCTKVRISRPLITSLPTLVTLVRWETAGWALHAVSPSARHICHLARDLCCTEPAASTSTRLSFAQHGEIALPYVMTYLTPCFTWNYWLSCQKQGLLPLHQSPPGTLSKQHCQGLCAPWLGLKSKEGVHEVSR